MTYTLNNQLWRISPKVTYNPVLKLQQMHPSVVMWFWYLTTSWPLWSAVIWLWCLIFFAGFSGKKHPLGKTDSLHHNKNCHKIRFSHVLTRLTSRITYNHNSGLNYSNKSRTIYILCHHRVPIWLLSHIKYWTIVNSIFIWDIRIHLSIT